MSHQPFHPVAPVAGTGLLLAMVGIAPDAGPGLNLLDTLLQPGGLGDHQVNAAEIRAIAWQRASREAAGDPALLERLHKLPRPESPALEQQTSPLVLTRVRTPLGELNFLSTFTTFGMPLDITVASLRIEHLIPADEQTWQHLRSAQGDRAPAGQCNPALSDS